MVYGADARRAEVTYDSRYRDTEAPNDRLMSMNGTGHLEAAVQVAH